MQANQRQEWMRKTTKGESLRPVLETVADWGLAHLPGTEVRVRPR